VLVCANDSCQSTASITKEDNRLKIAIVGVVFCCCLVSVFLKNRVGKCCVVHQPTLLTKVFYIAYEKKRQYWICAITG
ncbi:MAG: hypothetical protein SO115_04645, partial [Sodaliphilus sp.]|nr:hypothetical protein [Sodaliphilus sp.]